MSDEPRPGIATGADASAGRRRAPPSPAARPWVSARSCQRRACVPLARELLGERVREGEVHVVAAEEDVIADGDALEAQIAVPVDHRDEGKSVVPPPTSTTRMTSPGRTGLRQRLAHRVDPRVERGLRLLEERPRRRAPPARAASTVSSRAAASNDAGTVSVTPLRGERARRVALRDTRGPTRRAGARGSAPRRRAARRAAPPAARRPGGSRRAGRRRRGRASSSRTTTSRIGVCAPRLRASSPTSCAARLGRHGSASRARGQLRRVRQVQERRQERRGRARRPAGRAAGSANTSTAPVAARAAGARARCGSCRGRSRPRARRVTARPPPARPAS